MEVHKSCNTCHRNGGDHPGLPFGYQGPSGFKCGDCSASEREAAEAKRLENAPVERDLISRGYVTGAGLEIYPVLVGPHRTDGETCCDVVSLDSKASYWDLVEHGKSCETFYSLESVFQAYLLRAGELGILPSSKSTKA